MITDLFMLIIMIAFLIFGVSRPHVALCSAVWVNIVQPQSTSFSFLQGQQLSLFFTAFFFIVFFFNVRKIQVPRFFAYHFLMLGFMIWITISTFNAQFQQIAWIKYDVTIKTLIFAYFIPFALTNKKQVETFIWICAAAFLYFIFIGGLKSLLGGGGYGISLIGIGGFLYSEGSTLSTLAICMIPIILLLRSHTALAEKYVLLRHFLLFMILLCLAILVGTQARTGLVALAVFVIINFFQTNKKFKYILASMVFLMSFLMIATDEWYERMSTINEVKTTEKSAIGRLVVWRWTLDYVQERPFFGGGFYAHNANAGVLHEYQKGEEKAIVQDGGKAFHNIFFEVLGETGYGGLTFFCLIILHFLLLVRTKSKNALKKVFFLEEKKAIRASFIIYCCGGLFIGIAFFPWMYYLYCCSIAIAQIELNTAARSEAATHKFS
jgi:probable O-glycosylation ligase (exosortase A-associated)